MQKGGHSGERVEYDASGLRLAQPPAQSQRPSSRAGYVSKKASGELKYCGVDIPELLKHLKLTEHETLFIENGEKGYSVELRHLVGDELRVLLRYTVDGWDQGNKLARVSNVISFTAGK